MLAKDYSKELLKKFYDKNNNYPEKSYDYFCHKKSIIDAKEFLKEVDKELSKL
jgi:hypothetical protein